MRRTPLLTVLLSATLLFGALGHGSSVLAADLHATGAGVGCLDCHTLRQGTFGVSLPRGEEQEALCKSCHNPTGIASTMTAVAMHPVGEAGAVVDCGSCHGVHFPVTTVDTHPGGTTAENLSLVRNDTSRYVPGALEPALFQSRPDQFAFDDGNAPYNGICQTCHQNTSYHRNNASSPHSHGIGSDCTSCHEHKTGFMPSCTGCHSVAQDNGDGVPAAGRRPVVGEFPLNTAHAHVQNVGVGGGDCLVCHAMGSHQDGEIDLLDPDTGALYSFVTTADLTTDPDLSDFCAHCHDADGAARLSTPMDPFGGGNAPPDVATKFQGTLQWEVLYGDECFGVNGTNRPSNSHHDISDSDQAWSGAKLECLSCHSAHAAGDTQPLANPDAPTEPFTGSTSEHCMRCHNGGMGPDDVGMPAGVEPPLIFVDANGLPCSPGPGCFELSGLKPIDSCDYTAGPWWVDYTWTHDPHGLDSKRGWPNYSGAPEAVLECTDCHDPHGSFSPTNIEGNPYMIRDFVDGSMYVDDGVRPSNQWTGPPWNTYGAAREVDISVTPAGSYAQVDWGGAKGLCNACHSNWEAAYSWHTFCSACQTCHGHGQAWGAHDWSSSGADTSCQECGNGVVEGLEQCDDSNQIDGDGCSNECMIE